MALKWTNRRQLDLDFLYHETEYEKKVVKYLSVLGERVVKYARDDVSPNAHYTDRTANLRNSIGYIIVHQGRVVGESFPNNTTPKKEGGDPAAAKAQGLRYAREVARSLNPCKSYLVWVAGMEYARYVEAKGYDVIQGSGNWVKATANELRAEFKRYLMKRGL